MWWCMGNRGNRVNVNWDDWGIVGMGLTCGGVWGNRGNRVNVNWDDWGIVGMGLTCGGVWGTEGIGLL